MPFLLRGMSAGWRQGADSARDKSNIGRGTAKACRKTGVLIVMGHSQTGVRWGYRDRASAIDLARFTDA